MVGALVSGLSSPDSSLVARFSKLPVIIGLVLKLFSFPFQMRVSKVLKIIQ